MQHINKVEKEKLFLCAEEEGEGSNKFNLLSLIY